MIVRIDVYTTDIDAAVAAFKHAFESGASDLQLVRNADYETNQFENLNLCFEIDHSSEVISNLDGGKFARNPDDL